MQDDVKRMDVKDFRELGYLQELNRQFLHPMGLALEVVVEEDGTERLGGVWDYREDAEGIHYGDDMISDAKAERVIREARDRLNARFEALGYWIQPLGEPANKVTPDAL